MSPILQALQESVQWEHSDPEQSKKLNRLISLHNKVQTQFGLDFVNELSTAWDELHDAELDRAYEEGFLTAFRLWMEVSAIDAR